MAEPYSFFKVVNCGGELEAGMKQGLQSIRRFVESLGPYQSLALLAVPVCLVEPLKLIAVFVAGEGHWITGTVMITLAYAASLLVVERLFAVVKPKLLKLRWFARPWSRFVVQRYRLARVLRRA
jgi:hypothetical protein